MKLTVLKYGETELAENAIFQGGKIGVKRPIALLFFLIEQAGHRILVDVGCDTMPGFPLLRFCSPVKVLRESGWAESSVTDVIITHAHHDHIDALRYYPQANVYLHRREWDCAAPYVPSQDKLHLLDGDTAVCDGVKIKHIGGHTPGSCIVLLETPSSTWVLCGDECYDAENLTRGLVTGATVDVERSRAFVMEYRKEQYTTVLFHDSTLVKDIGARTLFDI